MKGQTRGAPLEPRAECENCGKKGLGNTYHATSAGAVKGRRAYRQCRYCDHIQWTKR